MLKVWELRGVTCHTGSLRVTCHPTQVNAPRHNPSQPGRYSIYLPRRDGRLSWPRWLVTYGDGLSVRRQQPFQVVTGPGVEQLETNTLTITSRCHSGRHSVCKKCIAAIPKASPLGPQLTRNNNGEQVGKTNMQSAAAAAAEGANRMARKHITSPCLHSHIWNPT